MSIKSMLAGEQRGKKENLSKVLSSGRRLTLSTWANCILRSCSKKHNDFFSTLNIWVEDQRKDPIEFHMVNVPEAAELHDRWATAANNGWEWREMHFQGIKQGKASQWQRREEKQIIKLIASSYVASRTLAEMLIAFLFSVTHWIGGVCAWERQGTHDSQTDAHTLKILGGSVLYSFFFFFLQHCFLYFFFFSHSFSKRGYFSLPVDRIKPPFRQIVLFLPQFSLPYLI